MPAQIIKSTFATQPSKLAYINNIKILMTMLVVMHHVAITYGWPDSWYYNEKTDNFAALVLMGMFVSVNQAFFMGFFFMLAAYFIPGSYDRKGAGKFLTNRLLKLGIPLAFYSFLLSPLLSYLVYYFAGKKHITYLQYLGGFDRWIDFGVLWFVAALLLFTIIYAAFRYFFNERPQNYVTVPNANTIIIFGVMLGVISFLVRIVFPVGWVLKPVGFQLGHFTQYIAYFIIGLHAFKNNWFEQLPRKTGIKLQKYALLMLLFFPVFYIIKAIFDIPVDWFLGGFHWQSLTYALWEQTIGITIMIALLFAGKRFWNRSSALLDRMSRSSYAVYIFHPLAIVSITLVIRNWEIDSAFKLLIVAPFAVCASFLLGFIVLAIPGVKKLL